MHRHNKYTIPTCTHRETDAGNRREPRRQAYPQPRHAHLNQQRGQHAGEKCPNQQKPEPQLADMNNSSNQVGQCNPSTQHRCVTANKHTVINHQKQTQLVGNPQGFFSEIFLAKNQFFCLFSPWASHTMACCRSITTAHYCTIKHTTLKPCPEPRHQTRNNTEHNNAPVNDSLPASKKPPAQLANSKRTEQAQPFGQVKMTLVNQLMNSSQIAIAVDYVACTVIKIMSTDTSKRTHEAATQ